MEESRWKNRDSVCLKSPRKSAWQSIIDNAGDNRPLAPDTPSTGAASTVYLTSHPRHLSQYAINREYLGGKFLNNTHRATRISTSLPGSFHASALALLRWLCCDSSSLPRTSETAWAGTRLPPASRQPEQNETRTRSRLQLNYTSVDHVRITGERGWIRGVEGCLRPNCHRSWTSVAASPLATLC
jgi:hypothetical protein